MSDEQRKDEEHEVEAHAKHSAHAEPVENGEDNDFEAHIRHSNVRIDSPKKD